MTNLLKFLRIFIKNTSISCQTNSPSRRPVFPLAYVKTKIFSILETKKGIPKNPFSVSNQTQIVARAEQLCPEGYFGGAEDLVIEWMPIGTEFEIDEYDGSESIRYKENEYWITT